MKKGLGRGLSALIGENSELEVIDQGGLSKISIEKIIANPNQPRTIFNQIEMDELMDSIKQNGILQPILVKSLDNDRYEIVAGERRWRAAKMLGLSNIPVIIKNYSEKETLEIALIENIQRENLNPLEEAETYKRLIDEYNYTQEKVSEVVSKSRSHVANLIRLLSLSEKVKNLLKEGNISLGHAKLLIGHNQRDDVVDAIVENKLNVRQTEEYLKGDQEKKELKLKKNKPSKKSSFLKDSDILLVEEHIRQNLGLIAEVELSEESNKISIYFNDMEDLDKIVMRLTNSIS